VRRLFFLSSLLSVLLATRLRAQDDDAGSPWLSQLFEMRQTEDERVSFNADYLYWYFNGLRVPPLATTAPLGSPAIVGQPGTEILRGNDRLECRFGGYGGIRLDSEWWWSRGSPFGLETSVALFERDSSNLTVPWESGATLTLPYIDAATGKWASYIVAGNSPQFGPLSGSINVYSRIEFFDEDADFMWRLSEGDNYRVILLAGSHFLQMREILRTTGTSLELPAQSTLLGVFDQFNTYDKFYGAQVGLKGEWRRGRLFVEGRGVMALGADSQMVATKGDRVVNTPLIRTETDYGLYVLPSNAGTFERAAFDVVTEWRLNVGWSFNSHLSCHVGYTLLSWNNPVRPGDQIEPVNLTQIAPGGLVGPLKPTIPFRTDIFWAQGLNVGLDLRW
jgi:putative beta barrel porin BBP7